METPPSLPSSIARPFLRLTLELGDTYSLSQLIGYVERWRGKPLRIEEDQMPPTMTGYSVALKDCDLIATHPRLSASQKRTTLLHEIAHFILGHIPLLSAGPATLPYEAFTERRDRFENVLSRQRIFDSYADLVEQDAETLARLCLQAVLHYERALSALSIDIYGER